MLQEASQNAVYKSKSIYSYIQDKSEQKKVTKKLQHYHCYQQWQWLQKKHQTRRTTEKSTIQMFQDILKYTWPATNIKSENEWDFEFICSSQIMRKINVGIYNENKLCFESITT